MEDTSDNEKEVSANKKSSISTIITITVVALVVVAFSVEAIVALKEGRSMNLEQLTKLLDTLTSLIAAPQE